MNLSDYILLLLTLLFSCSVLYYFMLPVFARYALDSVLCRSGNNGESVRASFAMAMPVYKFNILNTSFISIDQCSVVMKQAEVFR
jgi:hypothetical protein